MMEYNRGTINRQNESSFIQWICIEALKHDSAHCDAADCAVHTAVQISVRRSTAWEHWKPIFDKLIRNLM